MKRSALLAAGVVLIGAAGSVIACASLLGIEDGTLDDGGEEAGIQICSVDSGVQVDSSQLFVAHDFGDDSAGCTQQTPCKTIGAAINAANGHPEFHLIYVSSVTQRNDDGTPMVYKESLNLPPGVEIQGGWFARGRNPSVQWQQVCDATNESQTANIQGVDGTTVHAENLNGSITLTKLVIRTKPAAPGENVYGIFAGPTANVTLNDVILDIGQGGDGISGDSGDNGDPGVGTCTTTGNGSTPEAGAAGNAATAVTYGPTGGVGLPATPGGDGNAGSNGTPGSDGGCVNCVVCTFLTNCGGSDGTSCGTPGLAGCAGSRGNGGLPGQSGGSAIGVYAWGGAVTVNGGSVKMGNGGNGGNGGPGGQGGSGSDGTMGGDGPTCNTGCNNGCSSAPDKGMGSGGAAGGKGGNGSNGGQGGGGAGGDSFAFFAGIDASIESDAAVTPGQGGAGGAVGGASGKGQERFP